jgi:hypothetical protein
MPAQKKNKQKTLAPTFGPRKLGSLRSGIDPGAAAPVCFAAPPSAVYDCVVRSLRSPPRINPSTQPSDVAGGSRSRALELALIVEWGGFAAGSCAALLFCGSELAREGGLTADVILVVVPSPTVGVSLLAMAVFHSTDLYRLDQIPVGAGLPAMAASKPTNPH